MSSNNETKKSIKWGRGYMFEIDTECISRIFPPSTELVTWHNIDKVSSLSQSHVITPKTDGNRKLLICEYGTGDIYLLGPRDYDQPWLLHKGTQTTNTNGRSIQNFNTTTVSTAVSSASVEEGPTGFILDVVVVPKMLSGENLIVVHDILGYASNIRNSTMHSSFRSMDSFNLHSSKLNPHITTCVHFLRNFQERMELLSFLVDTIDSNYRMLMNPFYDNHTNFEDISSLWKMTQSLPYPVDGLLFIPLESRRMKENENLVYKWKPLDKLTVDVAIGAKLLSEDDGDSGEAFVPHLHKTDTQMQGNIYESQYSKKPNIVRFGERRKYPHITLMENHVPFYVDSNESNKGSHILTIEELKGRSEQVGKKAEDTSTLVIVPKEASSWAADQIVKVFYDVLSKSFKFLRIRYDKITSSTKDSIVNTLELFVKPLTLLDLQSRVSSANETICPSSSSSDKNYKRGRYETQEVERFQSKIKENLYELFSGASIIDSTYRESIHEDLFGKSRVQTVFALDQHSASNVKKNDSLLVPPVAGKVAALDGDGTQRFKTVDTCFCDMTTHEFWTSQKGCTPWIQNYLPLLRHSGLFIVTFRQSDKICHTKNIQIVNDAKENVIEVRLNEEKDQVTVMSKENKHLESIVDVDKITSMFQLTDMVHLGTFSCGLETFFGHQDFTKAEKELSNLYSVAVFQKQDERKKPSIPLLLDAIPQTSLHEIYSYLDIKEVVSLRQVCFAFLREVDCIATPERKGLIERIFNYIPFIMYQCELDDLLYHDDDKQDLVRLLPCAVACFLRFGGTIKRIYDNYDPADEYDAWVDNGCRSDYDSDPIEMWGPWGSQY